MKERFEYQREVHFYETDLMKIVHHANYLRFAEEARVAWAFQRGILTRDAPEEAARLAVLGTVVRHISPARFGDRLLIELQARREGIRIVFEYKIWIQEPDRLAAEIRTEHVALRTETTTQAGLMKVTVEKPTAQLKRVMENETWTETWLSNL